MTETQGTQNNRRTGRGRRIARLVLYLLFLSLLAELGARAFWTARGADFLTAQRTIHRSFYPAIGAVERACPAKDDDGYDVLILAGSVLHTDYGDVEHVLRERLARAIKRPVRIYNLSGAAHTSLDSLYKYKHLSDCHFDLVLVYHGINEVRANNCSASVFRADYGHLSWYDLINSYERRSDARWLIFPYTLKFVAMKTAGRLGLTDYVPTHEPDVESTAHGCEVKTATSFKANLAGILKTAKRRGERVLLMSFASYLPEGYTRGRFERRELDYTTYTYPVELWGRADCVRAGIFMHNAIVEELATGGDDVDYVAQHKLIPREGRYFNDVCHLTHEGCERFVQNILPMILSQAN